MYKFLCFKIEKLTKADSYMPCEAMAHSTKFTKQLSFSILLYEWFGAVCENLCIATLTFEQTYF